MTKFFGTDGIRGKTGDFPITPDFFVKIGYAAGLVLTKHHNLESNPTVVIGKDTRISGYMFESVHRTTLMMTMALNYSLIMVLSCHKA